MSLAGRAIKAWEEVHEARLAETQQERIRATEIACERARRREDFASKVITEIVGVVPVMTVIANWIDDADPFPTPDWLPRYAVAFDVDGITLVWTEGHAAGPDLWTRGSESGTLTMMLHCDKCSAMVPTFGQIATLADIGRNLADPGRVLCAEHAPPLEPDEVEGVVDVEALLAAKPTAYERQLIEALRAMMDDVRGGW